MRVLSPRIEPPLRVLDGSTASTATRWPASTRCRPSASMNVDLPAPGAPLMPTRIAPPVAGSSASSSATASSRWSARVDSTSVIARASARRSPRAHRVGERRSSPSSVTRRGARGPARGSRDAACGMLRARAEDRGHAGVVQEVVVLRRDHAADDHDDVAGALRLAAPR